MNNQRNNNNRRRGRGNNRGGGGGGNPVNRIDSRARGNAPQMLEKYRKLAHEASLNDDRVQTEYYLQFADHYFRVIADAKAQKDEQQGQGRQRSDREADDGDDYFEDDRFGDRRPQQQRQERAPQGDDEEPEMPRGTEGDPVEDEANPFLAPRQQRRDRDNREGREGRDNRDNRDRDNRSRNERRPRREDNRADAGEEAAPTFDPGMLPPSISRSAAEEEPAVPVDTAEAAPAPKPRRTRTPRKKSEGDGGGEALEAVG